MGYVQSGMKFSSNNESPIKKFTLKKSQNLIEKEKVGKGKYHYTKAGNRKSEDEHYKHEYLKEDSMNVDAEKSKEKGRLKWGYPKFVKQ